MTHDPRIRPCHSAVLPAGLRGTRQALFFLLAQHHDVRPDTEAPSPYRLTSPLPDAAPIRPQAEPQLSAILTSDDFQFTF